jgi:predicted RNA-binding protein
MCEATAYVLRAGKEEICLKDVDLLESVGDELHMTSLYGEHKVLKGIITSISLVDHKILLQEL